MTSLEQLKDRIADAAAGPFAHDDYPLAETLRYPGDPGLFGPASATWQVTAHAAIFIGGIRTLLVQAAHPEVVAGVHDHSTYRQDPLGRLSRTSSYVTATAYGAMPEVEEAIAKVRRAHVPVKGTSHRGTRYTAGKAEFAAWVHNAMIESFGATFRAFGPRQPNDRLLDRYVSEQRKVAELLNADPLPDTWESLSNWVADHPDLAPSPGMRDVVRFLKTPPFDSRLLRFAYRLMFIAAVATVPERIRTMLGLRALPGALALGRVMAGFLNWALGTSPALRAALYRVGAPTPSYARFRRPIPPEVLAFEQAQRQGS